MTKRLCRLALAAAIAGAAVAGPAGLASADSFGSNAPEEVQLCQAIRRVFFGEFNQGQCIKLFRTLGG